MEPVKTCATCRHSTVGRRDSMDWWKRRLCAHPGLVDRVEGRPIHEAESARGREGPCGLAGTLWEGVPAAADDKWVQMNEIDTARMQRIFSDAFEPDPVDAALGPGVLRVYNDKTQTLDPVPPERVDGYGMPASEPLFKGDLPQGEGLSVRIAPDMLSRKPAKRAKRKASKEGKE